MTQTDTNSHLAAAKHPKINILPHTLDTPPEVWCGLHKYHFDLTQAAYWASVLTSYVQWEVQKRHGPQTGVLSDG